MNKLTKGILWMNRWYVAMVTAYALLLIVVPPQGPGVTAFLTPFCLMPLVWTMISLDAFRVIQTLPVTLDEVADAKWRIAVYGAGAIALVYCVASCAAGVVTGLPGYVALSDIPWRSVGCLAMMGSVVHYMTLCIRWRTANSALRKTWACVVYAGALIAGAVWWVHRPEYFPLGLSLLVALTASLLPVVLLLWAGPLSVVTVAAMFGILLAGPGAFLEYAPVGYPAVALGLFLTWRAYVHRGHLRPVVPPEPLPIAQTPDPPERVFERLNEPGLTLLTPVFIVPLILGLVFWGLFLLFAVAGGPRHALPAFLGPLGFLCVLAAVGRSPARYMPRIARMLPGTPLDFTLQAFARALAGGMAALVLAVPPTLLIEPAPAVASASAVACSSGLACFALGFSLLLEPRRRAFVILFFMLLALGSGVPLIVPGMAVHSLLVCLGFAIGVLGMLGGFALTYYAVTRTFSAYSMETVDAQTRV